jgi:3'-phosphoadenosine 5'-phosphosulfate (PAPS) 3'-phosphatase
MDFIMPDEPHFSVFLPRNLKALIAYLGENVDTIEKDGREIWFEDAGVKRRFGKSDFFPGRSTVSSWIPNKKIDDGTTYTPSLLFVLCAYLRFGRYKKGLPQFYTNEVRALADDLCIIDSVEVFKNAWKHLPRAISDATEAITNPPLDEPPDEETITELMRTAILAVHEAQREIRKERTKLEHSPTAAEGDFDHVLTDTGEHTSSVDRRVEDAVRDVFLSRYKERVHVEGEESLKYKAFTGWKTRYCVLVDAVDGTDLVAMGVDLWCSAIAIYDHSHRRVLGSIVGLPSGAICATRVDRKKAWFVPDQRNVDGAWLESNAQVGALPTDQILAGCSGTKDPLKAHIAYYGQKPDSFLAVATNRKFLEFLQKVDGKRKRGHKSKVRIYNFAGNPIMVKLADRKMGRSDQPVADGVDIIFEIRGQKAHDFVPGAYIATQMGAHLCDLSGALISESDLGTKVEYPCSKTVYLLAATRQLALAFVQSLSPAESPAGTLLDSSL